MSHKKIAIKAMLLGILSSMFLSVGLIVNSLLAWKGNNWAWTASLRFLLLFPLLIILVASKGKLKPLFKVFAIIPWSFITWGCIGFAIFYGFLTSASLFAPGWLVAAAFETTILIGPLLAPLIYKDHRATVDGKIIAIASFVVSCLFMLQLGHLSFTSFNITFIWGSVLALIAAILWPLGNRKIMIQLEERELHLNAMQRVLGMTIGSLPMLLCLAGYGYWKSGLPGYNQIESSFLAVIFSGVLGSILFFKALSLVKSNAIAMAAVEGTQVTVVVFTLVGEMIFKGTSWPGLYADIGLFGILIGLLLYVNLSINNVDKVL